jgi:hypothetical protein
MMSSERSRPSFRQRVGGSDMDRSCSPFLSTTSSRRIHCCSYNSSDEQHPTAQQQARCFSSHRQHTYSKLKKKKTKKTVQDYLQVLGIESKSKSNKDDNAIIHDIPYAQVKTAFLKIALMHHPDTSKAATPEDRDADQETFRQARTALEMLAEGPDGSVVLRDEAATTATSDSSDLESWFQQETGYDMPYMDAQTMQEVAAMTEREGLGLDRDGGMWTLARMVAQSVKDGGDGGDVLRIEAGEERSREINGILRRKRTR